MNFGTRTLRRWTLLIIGALLVSPVTAFAAPSESDRERAGQLMEQGEAHVSAGRLELALSSYRLADDIMGVPSSRLAVARVLENLGKLVEAREAAVQANRMPITPREPSAFTTARLQAARLMIELDERIPTLVVQVQTPNGLVPEVTVNAVPIPKEQLGTARRLNPASYQIVAKATGCESVMQEIKLAEGETRLLTLSLKLVPTAPSAAPPVATVPKQAPVPPASHKLAYVGFGVGALGVTVGTVTGLLVLSKSKALKDACPDHSCPETQDGQLQTARNLGWVSTISFGVGLVGAGVGLVSLMASPPPAAASAGIHIRPVVGLGQLGILGDF